MAYIAVTASTDATARIRYLESYTFSENAGTPAAARVLMRDGSSSGTIVADIQLALSTTASQSFAKPLYFPSGLYVQVSAGTVRGSIRGT